MHNTLQKKEERASPCHQIHTMHVASCTLPSFGRMNGAIWLHKNVCTETGRSRSCIPSTSSGRPGLSSGSSFSSSSSSKSSTSSAWMPSVSLMIRIVGWLCSGGKPPSLNMRRKIDDEEEEEEVWWLCNWVIFYVAILCLWNVVFSQLFQLQLGRQL